MSPLWRPRLRFVDAGVILILNLFFLAAVPGFGQTFSGTLRGTVTDPAGTVVPGASIELKNSATNDLRRATSGPAGTYEFTNLLPGTYGLSAQAPGFKQFIRTNMVLQAGTAAELNIPLEIGAVTEKVEVTAQAVLLDTESADHTATLNQTLMTQLPTGSKQALNFVFALAGTTDTSMTQRNGTNEHQSSMFGLQGGRGGNAEILIDGAPSTSVDWGSVLATPTIEDVQEMQVVRNTYDAQYAKSGGGIVTLITKGGSNEFHGVAYEYLQNDNLNANTWWDNKNGGSKGEFKRNQFGGNVTGPIWRRKGLFFLGSYEGLRQPFTNSTGWVTVPTAEMRQGDFSKIVNGDGTPAIIYNPFSTRKLADGGYTRDAFAGNQIPQSLMDPVGVKVASFYPLPNRQGLNGQNNYYNQAAGRALNDKVESRIDWAQSEKHRIFARFTSRFRQNTDPGCFFCNGADSNYKLTGPGWQGVINDTITPGPTWIVNTLVSAGRFNEGQRSLSYGKLSAGSLGLTPADYQAPVMPNFSVANYAGIGDNSYRDLVRLTHSAELNITKQMSSHTFKFGADFRVQMINNNDVKSGSFSFNRDFTSCDPAAGGGCVVPTGSSSVSGDALASLLLGTGGGSSNLKIAPALSLHTFGVYFEDSWRVNRKLTLNLGLRYENQRPVTERYNRMAAFDPNVLSPLNGQVEPLLGRKLYGGFVYASESNRFIYDPHNKDFAPRVGFAYKLTNRLVARAGAGIFFGPASSMIGFDDGMFLGYATSTPWISSENNLGFVPTNRLSNPYPNGINQPTGSKNGLMTQVNYGGEQIWVKQPYPNPYKLHFSFDLQYELGPGSVVEVGYTGWRARKLMYGNPDLNIDQLPSSYLKLGPELDKEVANPFNGILSPNGFYGGETMRYSDLLKPFPQFGWLTMNRSTRGARANFDGLNVRFSHQFSQGLNILSTYQYSKTMDNGSEDMLGWGVGGTWRDAYNTMLDYGLSQHDMPHSFVTALVYELPVGKGKKFGSGMPAIANAVVGGWQVSPIVRLNSGFPLLPIWWQNTNSLSPYGFPGNERPDLVGNPVISNPTPDKWFDPSAFKRAAPYTIGNSPRNFDGLRESATKNLDLGLAKNFKAEAFKIQFRAEFMNAFNTPAFGGGGIGWGNILNCVDCWGSEAKVVAGQRNEPRMIQLGIRIEY